MNRKIQASGARSTKGKLFDVGEMSDVRIRAGYDATPHSLFLMVDKTAGAALVHLTVGESEGGAEHAVDFHVDGRGVWLSVAGWRYCKVEITSIPDGMTLRYTWLTEPHVSSVQAAARFWQIVPAGAASTPIPSGSIAVTPDQNVAGANWTTNDGTNVFNIPASLVAGTRTENRGGQLTYAAPLGAPLTLCWELETL